jgi:D-xylose transport system substrate-binding protein
MDIHFKLYKTSILIIAISIAFLVSSCSSRNSVKIGFMLPTLTQDRFPKERDYFIAKVKSLGGEVLFADAQFNDDLQVQQADDLINQGAQVLVIACVNKVKAAIIVRNAHRKNIKVIAYERIIVNCDLDYYVSFDNVKVGEQMANYAVKHKPQGSYVLLGGDKSDQNAIWVKQGQQNILDPLIKQGKIKITYDTYIEDWSPANAYFEMKKYLELGGEAPDAILSSYDGMSTGTINAFQENNSNLPVITGQNAELQACRNIVSGKQSMTVYKPFKLEAETAAEFAIKCAKGEQIDLGGKTINNGLIEVSSLLITPISVDAENMRSTIIASGFFKESEVYSFK